MSLKDFQKAMQRRMLRRSLQLMSARVMERRHTADCRRALVRFDKTRAAGGFYRESLALKTIELDRLRLRTRPARVVDLGGGATSCVAAHTISAFSGRLQPIDKSPEYGRSTRDRMPDAPCQYLRFEVVPKLEDRDGSGTRNMRYDHRLRETARDFASGLEIDLLHVDGPSNQRNGKLLPCTNCCRLLDAVFSPPVRVFECRQESIRYFLGSMQTLPDHCILHHRAMHEDPWPVHAARHHRVFTKRNLS